MPRKIITGLFHTNYFQEIDPLPRQIIIALLHTNASEASKHRDPSSEDLSWDDQLSSENVFQTVDLFIVFKGFEFAASFIISRLK